MNLKILISMIREQINLFLVIFALLLPSILFAQSNNTEFQIGKRAYEEYRYTFALPHLQAALKNGCCEANYYIGRIWEYRSEHKTAIKYYKDGAECGDPKSMVALWHYGYEDFKKQIGLDSLDEINYLKKAMSQGYGEAYKTAAYRCDSQTKLNYFKKAEALGANCSKEIASCYYYDFHDYDSVLYYAQRAIFSYGDRCDCLYYLGMAYYYLNDYKQSINWLSYFCRVEGWYHEKSKALHILGRIYENGGHGVTKDLEKAKQLYSYSAFLDMDWSDDSKIRLLEIAALGDLSEQESIKLIPYVFDVYNEIKNNTFKDKMSALSAQIHRDMNLSFSSKSAAKNHVTGIFYINEKDTIRAIECYKTAIDQGSNEACVDYGRLLYEGGKKEEAHHFLAKAANAGNVDASHLLYSYFGETVLSNDKYNYAIHQSIIESKLHGLENRAQKGEIRYEVVADAYLDAFKEGILFTPEYQYNDTLYEEYDSGIGRRWSISYRPRKYNYTLDQAIRYYYEAENYERVFDLYQDFIGHTEIGKLYMGLCFYHRRGAQESSFEDDDSEQGLKMIEDAAKRNNPTAMLILGNILRKKGQYEEAVHWYRIASHFGHREAMRNLALCYDKGLGTDVNKTLAKEWLKKAKELGDLKH